MMTKDSRPRRASWMPMPIPAKPAPTIRTSTDVTPEPSDTGDDLAVSGGALADRAADLPGDPLDVVAAEDEPGLRSRPGREAAVEEQAAEVVGAAAGQVNRRVEAELGPGRLDIADALVQHQPGPRVHRQDLPPGRTGNVGADQAGGSSPGGGGDERHGDELGETAGPVLDPGQRPQVRDLVPGPDPPAPAGPRKVAAARQTAAHVVVEDARGGAGNRAESLLSGGGQELPQRHTPAGCPVEQLRGPECVQVDLGRGRLDGG